MVFCLVHAGIWGFLVVLSRPGNQEEVPGYHCRNEPEEEIMAPWEWGDVQNGHKEKGILLPGQGYNATPTEYEFGAAQGFVWPGRGRQDAELSAKEGPSQVGQPGDDDSLQGQRRRAWTP